MLNQNTVSFAACWLGISSGTLKWGPDEGGPLVAWGGLKGHLWLGGGSFFHVISHPKSCHVLQAPTVQQQSFGPKDSFESNDSNGQHA